MLCFQLSSDFDSLSKVASVWLSSLNNIECEAVADLCHSVKNNVTSVGTQLQLLLQVHVMCIVVLFNHYYLGWLFHIFRVIISYVQ